MSSHSLLPIFLLSLHLLTLISLATPFALRLYVSTTFHRLKVLRLEKRADAFKPHVYTPFTLLLHPESGLGITRQDLEAIKTMVPTRRAALCGPLACIPGLAAMTTWLHLAIHSNNCVDRNEANSHSCTSPAAVPVTIALLLLLLLLVIFHCLNASNIHRYFSLVENERCLIFGEAIRPARQERLHSHGLKKVYLTVLFVLCGVDSCWSGPGSVTKYQMRRAGVREEET